MSVYRTLGIEQQEVRLLREGAGEQRALTFAAGERRELAILERQRTASVSACVTICSDAVELNNDRCQFAVSDMGDGTHLRQ